MEELVVLVDEQDREIGTAAKMPAHTTGKLHRALSVFLFDGEGRFLMQKRAATKYHSGGLWSNSCCSHPRPGESVEVAAHRRLREELGVNCPLRAVLSFIYRIELENGLVEHEYDHVFVGRFDGTPKPNSAEVDDWRWSTVEEITQDSAAHPETYSAWFQLALDRLLAAQLAELIQ